MAETTGAIKAGRAYVELFADKSKLVADLKTVGKDIAAVGSAMAAAAAAIGVGVLASVNSFATAGDAITKIGQKTGIGAEMLSSLGYAASQSGSSLEAIGPAINKMQRYLTEASGAGGEARDTIEALGLSVEQLRSKSPDAQFKAIADKIAGIQDPATKTAAAMRIFGKGAADLIPLLDETGSGIQKLQDDARRLGLVFTADMAAKATETGDRMDDLKKVVSQAAIEIGYALAPAVIEATAALTNILVEFNSFIARNHEAIGAVGDFVGAAAVFVASGLADYFRLCAEGVLLIKDNLESTKELMKWFIPAAGLLPDFSKNQPPSVSTASAPETSAATGVKATTTPDLDLTGLKRKLAEQSMAIQIASIKDAEAREKAQIGLKYSKLAGEDSTGKNAAQIETMKQQELSKITEKFADQRAAAMEDLQIAAMEAGYQKQVLQTNAHYERLIAAAKENGREQEALKKQQQRALANIEIDMLRSAQERLDQLALAGIENRYARERAAIEMQHRDALAQAGGNPELIAAADEARRRGLANQGVGESNDVRSQERDVAKLELEVANKNKSNTEQRKAMIELERRFAIEDAARTGANIDLLNRQFDLQQQLVDLPTFDTRGTISGFEIQSLQSGGGQGPAERTAKATEKMLTMFAELNGLTKRQLDAIQASGMFG